MLKFYQFQFTQVNCLITFPDKLNKSFKERKKKETVVSNIADMLISSVSVGLLKH